MQLPSEKEGAGFGYAVCTFILYSIVFWTTVMHNKQIKLNKPPKSNENPKLFC